MNLQVGGLDYLDIFGAITVAEVGCFFEIWECCELCSCDYIESVDFIVHFGFGCIKTG